MLKTQNQDAILAQAIAGTSKNQTSTVPENSSKCNTRKISETESRDKDKQVWSCVLLLDIPKDILSPFLFIRFKFKMILVPFYI